MKDTEINQSLDQKWSGLFYCLKVMKTTEENHLAMLEFWEDMIQLAKIRGDFEALENIPTDIYMLLGYDIREFFGLPTEDEEAGYVFANGCSRTSAVTYG